MAPTVATRIQLKVEVKRAPVKAGLFVDDGGERNCNYPVNHLLNIVLSDLKTCFFYIFSYLKYSTLIPRVKM